MGSVSVSTSSLGYSLEQTIMDNNTPDLPQEIITHILVRLSVKTLIRFQCVCKYWKNLFRTPSFIAEHLHHSTQQNPLLIADSIISEGNPWNLCLLNRGMQFLSPSHPLPYDERLSRCIYSCNGLLCVELMVKSQYTICFWNPAIREVRKVPKSLDYGIGYVGFGFSPVISDYKIVKLFVPDHLILQVQVYSLRTGLWKNVEPRNLEGIYISDFKHCVCNGAILWPAKKEDLKEDVKIYRSLIVSFDIATEVFTLIPFPTKISAEFFYSPLSSYEGKLAVFLPTDNNNSDMIDIWVLEESTDPTRERWSWAKMFTSKPNPYGFIIGPIIIWRNEVVFGVEEDNHEGEEEENHGVKLVLCNLSTNEFNLFDIPKFRCDHQQVFDYAESLVLLDSVHI